MRRSSVDNRDRVAIRGGRDPGRRADEPVSGTAGGTGRHARGASSHRATHVWSTQALDYRLRSLDTQQQGRVPTTSTRTNGRARRRGRIPLLAKAAGLLAVAALTALLLRGFVVESFSVPGNAMTPTFEPGDRILVVRSAALASPVRSGEIVVFRPQRSLPCMAGGGSGDLALRVVAVPGETIWSVGSTIFVDGRPLSERGWYDPRSGQLGSIPIVSTTLRRDQYFVLADNRADACDSRAFGPISMSSIVGEGVAIVGRDGHVFFRTL